MRLKRYWMELFWAQKFPELQKFVASLSKNIQIHSIGLEICVSSKIFLKAESANFLNFSAEVYPVKNEAEKILDGAVLGK